MPQPNKIPRPFADSGDKNSIPDSSGSIGFASWQEGFPAITSEPFASGGVAPKRADFNGIFNALSAATLWYQQGGVYAYDNATDYEVGNLVIYSGVLYICLVANGPNSAIKAPTQATYWEQLSDIFETGTFTPTIFGGTDAGVFLYTNRTGNYVKFGPLCYVDLRVDGKVVTAPSGPPNVGGLPYIAASAQQSLLINQCSPTMNYAPFMIRLSSSLGQGNLFGVNTNNQTLVAINFQNGLAVDTVVAIRACGIYRVA